MPIVTPMKSGCFLVGRAAAMVVRAPVVMPEDPKPAMARPMMNMVDDWAAPHRAEPISKTVKKMRKHHWKETR
jgi:hypothetical protein